MTHTEWQEQVRQLATILGYRVLHVRKSIGKGRQWTTATSIVGWPDLWCYHPKHGGFVAIELKVGRDTATPEQLAVLADLAAAGARTMVAYPDDLDAVRALLDVRPPANRG